MIFNGEREYIKGHLFKLYSIHVVYVGRGGWGHNYRTAHGIPLRDIVNFELHKSHEAARTILRSCGLRFPNTLFIDAGEMSIIWVATAFLELGRVLQAAKILEKERDQYLDSHPPVELTYHNDPLSVMNMNF